MNDPNVISRERSLAIRRTNAVMWQKITEFRYARARVAYIGKSFAASAAFQQQAAEAYNRMCFYRDRYQSRLSSEK